MDHSGVGPPSDGGPPPLRGQIQGRDRWRAHRHFPAYTVPAGGPAGGRWPSADDAQGEERAPPDERGTRDESPGKYRSR
jgi:hypothetical protein